jgi:membrane associated rhomboid family serine protease
MPPRSRYLAVPIFLGLNLVVFGGWQLARYNPDLAQFLMDNFVVSSGRLAEGRLWTLLTAAISQAAFFHLLLNMIVLHSFGGVVERLMGSRRFVWFYLSAAVFSSLCHCFTSSALMDRGDVGALGASGVMSGLLLIFALLFPKRKILVFGVMPVPALFGALGFIALDVWGLIAQSQGSGLPIGHSAHLGGSLLGALVYFGYLRPRRQQLNRAYLTAAFGLSPDELATAERLQLKIHQEGKESLTPKEQEFLRQLAERSRRSTR